MPHLSNRTKKSQHMEVDSSDSDELEALSQVSTSMKRISVSQKRQKSKGSNRQIVSDSDEEPQPSTSQASQQSQKKRKNHASQSQRGHQSSQANGVSDTLMMEEIPASQISPNTSLTDQEHSHHVANVVKYILAANHTNIPIDRSKISKGIDCHNRNFKEVYKSALEILEDVFGYEVEELEEENKNKNKFFLVNTIDSEVSREDIDEEISTRYVLLFLTLAHIFMSGDKCDDESLWTFLKKLGIIENHYARHELFGDVKDVILNEFHREKYLAIEKDVNDTEKLEFRWGIRAIKELTPRAVMEFVSEVYSGKSIDSWPQQYESLLRKEQGVNQNK